MFLLRSFNNTFSLINFFLSSFLVTPSSYSSALLLLQSRLSFSFPPPDHQTSRYSNRISLFILPYECKRNTSLTIKTTTMTKTTFFDASKIISFSRVYASAQTAGASDDSARFARHAAVSLRTRRYYRSSGSAFLSTDDNRKRRRKQRKRS